MQAIGHAGVLPCSSPQAFSAAVDLAGYQTKVLIKLIGYLRIQFCTCIFKIKFMTKETQEPVSPEDDEFTDAEETESLITREEKFARIYRIGKLACLAIIAGTFLFFVLRGQPGRYVKYGRGDLILDTQTGEILLYDVQTMELKPHKPQHIEY